MKTGTITYYIEIPVTIGYSCYPAEERTKHYPGCDAGCTVDYYGFPSENEISKMVDKDADSIKEACAEDAEKSP